MTAIGASCLYEMLWTLLSLEGPPFQLWGAHHATLTDFLQQLDNQPVAIADLIWFRDVLCNWGPSQDQKDSAECTQRLLNWLQTSAFDMSWERRLETADGIVIADHNTAYTPITLTITRHVHDSGACTLNDLLCLWSQEHSMRAALLGAPPCICLAIDRYYQDEAGNIGRSMCHIGVETEVNLPVFISNALRWDYTGYIPVAGVAHMGLDMAGHCKALLKLAPTLISVTQPAAWMETEDGQAPRPIWQVPTWFSQHSTVIWLVRTDCLQLQTYRHPLRDMTIAPMNEDEFQTAEHTASMVPDHHAALDTQLLTLLRAQSGAMEDT